MEWLEYSPNPEGWNDKRSHAKEENPKGLELSTWCLFA